MEDPRNSWLGETRREGKKLRVLYDSSLCDENRVCISLGIGGPFKESYYFGVCYFLE